VNGRVRLNGKEYEIRISDALAQTDDLKVSREFVKIAGTIQEPGSSQSRRFQAHNYDAIIDGQKRLTFQAKLFRIIRPPGSRLNWLADFFCSPKTMKRVVSPILSDLQTEYCAALAEDRIWKARWICVRGYISFWKTLAWHTVAKSLMQIWKISGLP
jgi:hypothetical protein